MNYSAINLPPESRPPCPECGGRAVSHGASWGCGLCGKYWQKYERKGKVFGTRPPCPECGGNRINSNGAQWRCESCGRRWVKEHMKRRKINDNKNHKN